MPRRDAGSSATPLRQKSRVYRELSRIGAYHLGAFPTLLLTYLANVFIIINMNTEKRIARKVKIPPAVEHNLITMGEQIKLARLRRRYSVQLVAERAGISRATLWKVEKGDAGVAIGIYAKVLSAIGLPDDITLLARDDTLGRFLQDAELLHKGERK